VHDHIVAVVIIAAGTRWITRRIVSVMWWRRWGRRHVPNHNLRTMAMNRADAAINMANVMNPGSVVNATRNINRGDAVRLDHIAATEIRRVIAVSVKAATGRICLCGR
jgi:hypothetical protein